MSSLAAAMIEVVGRAFVLMSSAWLVAFLMRRRSASLRAGVWTVAFASLLALPVVARVTPSWKIAVLPAIEATPVAVPQVETAPKTTSGVVFQETTPDVVFSRGSSARGSAFKNHDVPLQAASKTTSGVVFQETTPDVVSSGVVSAATPVSIPATAVALLVWATVAGLLTARIAVNRVAAARLIRSAASHRDGDAEWRADIETARVELGIARSVRIRFTDAVAVPAVIGVWRPTLLLPLDAGGWTPEARRVVILHELAHVARWDAFDQLVTEAGCALYWIVPPVWIAARSAAALREQATDDAVIRAGVRPSAYAAELIDLAQNIAGVQASAASLAMAGSSIKHRVTAILDPAARRGRLTTSGALTLILVAGLTVTTVAAVTPERQVVVPPTVAEAPMGKPMPLAVATSAAAVVPVADDLQFPPPAPPAPPIPATPPAPPSAPAPMSVDVPPAPPAPMSPPRQIPPIQPPPMPAPMAPMAPPPAMAIAPIPPMPPGPAPAPPAPKAPAIGSRSGSRSGPERSTLCPDGRDNFSNMSNNDGSRQTWSIKISGRGCLVELKSEGKIEFNDDFTDVAAITPSGYFRLSVSRGGSRQELDIDGRGSALTRAYRIDGSARAYDAAAKAWFGAFLVDLDRETAIGVDVRLPKLLKQGGVDAVLKETALMTSDYARSRYYGKLGASVKLSAADTVRILNQAASLGTQDYYAAELLKSLGNQVGDSATERAALVALLNNMRSDYYIVEGVNSVFSSRGVNASDVDFLMRLMPRVQSDYYKYEMVKRIVASGRVDGAQRGALAQTLTSMTEDYYMSAVLAELMRGGQPNDAGRQAIIGAVTRIKSGYYASEAVRSVLEDARLGESDLVRLVDVVKPIREDHYKSEALRAIARHANATAKVRQAAGDATAGMSQFYRDEVLRAVRLT